MFIIDPALELSMWPCFRDGNQHEPHNEFFDMYPASLIR